MKNLTAQKRRRARRHGEEGLTLIELMMAAGVVLIGIVMTMSAILAISQTTASNEDLTKARSHLATVAEDLRSRALEDIVAYTAPAMEGLGAFETISISVVDSGGNLVPVPVAANYDSSALPNPLQVRITVTWRSGAGRVLAQTLTTFVRR